MNFYWGMIVNRRAFIHGLTGLSVTVLAEPVLAAPAPPALVVYHFVTPGCDDCRHWDQKHLGAWLNSGEFRRTAYRRIEAETVEHALDPRRWPSEARSVAASLRQTPAFVLVRLGRPIAAAAGSDGWAQVMWPAIRRAAA